MIRKPLKTLAGLVAIAVVAGALVLTAGGPAVAQDRTVNSSVSIEQDQINTYSVNRVLQAGRQFFAVDFLEADGHGEGDNGPRAGMRVALWKGAGLDEKFPFLRLNGLDSQSCFACHNSAGTHTPEGELFNTQKPGGVGGAADFASVLFGNALFPEESTGSGSFEQREAPDFETTGRLTHVVRTPPRAFGSAYAQELALEMTEELIEIVEDARSDAQANPGIGVIRQLTTKGVNFGTFSVTCSSSTSCSETLNNEGIGDDLIVRPFQAKGIAATVRSFSKTALDFHHSLQGVEVVGIDQDCDQDGLINEMAVDNVNPAFNSTALAVQQSLGNVLALSAFTGMVRPPTEASYAGNGEAIFDEIGCSDCHVKSMETRVEPQFRIQIAQPADGCPTNCGGYGCSSQLGSFAEVDATVHPAKEAANATLQAKQSGSFAAGFCPAGFYCIDLTNPGTLPGDFYPRIPANKDGTVTVRMFSDLKRHDMGVQLAQTTPPQADDAGNTIPNREWLTQKLWGVRDNGPWLHDGRARSLHEAIVMHAGENGNDTTSDAHGEVQNFLGLSAADQQEVVDFLESLTIPLPQ